MNTNSQMDKQISSISKTVCLKNNPILTQTVTKDKENIFQATIYDDKTIVFNKQVKLSPDEFKEIINLKDKMVIESPGCCHDIPQSWAMNYMTIHDINKTFCTSGSCLKATMKSCHEIEKLLEGKFEENIFKDNRYS